jgi:two-component system OmpR family response regulator
MKASAMRVLVAEDQAKMASLLKRGLEADGYAVDVAADGEDALWYGTEWEYDAIILDIGLPYRDGIEVCRVLRDRGRWAPVLMLTVRDTVEDRVAGLDCGADDYLTKPFDFEELLARLRALTRRTPTPRPAVLEWGDLRLDPATKTLTRDGTPIDLSPKEFALLHLLMTRGEMVTSRTEILDHVWDFAYDGTSNVVDVYIRYLRNKIDRPFSCDTIETIRGEGYRLRPVEAG